MKTKITNICRKFNNYGFCGALFILTLILIILKFGVIYWSYKNLSPRKYCFKYLISDIYFLITIIFFITTSFSIKNSIVRWINNTLIVFLLIIFYVDIFTIYFFQSHETIISILNFIKFGGFGFTDIAILWLTALFILFCICLFLLSYTRIGTYLSKIFTPKLFLSYYVLGISIYSIQTLIIGIPISDTKNILSINIQSIKEMIDENILVTETDYEDYIKYETGDGKKLNVILIFYESASAIDSAHLGGNNNMPYLDIIQQNGLSFTNFISHGTASYWAHISTLLGAFFTKYDYIYNSNEGLAKFLNNQGYKTTFISSAPLKFLNQRSFLEDVGFQNIIGEEEFQDKKKYSFDAAPDGDLYDRVLKEVQIQTGNYFIGLQTISFHVPYNSPYCTKNGNHMYQTLKYSDEKLYDFYVSLKNIGFFRSGILIIIGDHRKASPIEAGEYDIFGETRKYRSVATVVGSGIKPGSINNNLTQHTDFYHSVKKLLGNGDIPVDMFYNDIFSSTANRSRGIVDNNNFIVFDGDNYSILDINDIKKQQDIYNYYFAAKSHRLKVNIASKNL